jgi:hypothetical protein
MNEFRIFAHGVDFDPDAYRAKSTLVFDGVWRKGESGNNHPASSGIYKSLGNGMAPTIFEQERIAIDYLSQNRDALRTLSEHPNVTTFNLGLQYHIRLGENTVGFCMGPSALLMWHCLDIGIAPVFYVSLDASEPR